MNQNKILKLKHEIEVDTSHPSIPSISSSDPGSGRGVSSLNKETQTSLSQPLSQLLGMNLKAFPGDP